MSFLGIVAYGVLYPLQQALGIEDSPSLQILNGYLINLAVSVLPLALGVLAF